MNQLVLSLFPGIGLLDRAFEETDFCVVRGPDLIWGADVRNFHGVSGKFGGLLAGPPCQGFSVANTHRKDPNHHSVRNSREMLQHTCRVITECQPEWFLIENVPCVPDVRIAGYSIQRIPITDMECGGVQLRSRHIQFGSINGDIIRPIRVNNCTRNRKKGRSPKSVTTKTDRWTDYPDLCRRQGLDEPIELNGVYRTTKFIWIGQGVPLRMGRVLAAAVSVRGPRIPETDCQCDCGRSVSARALTATASCRKRKEMASKQNPPWVDVHGYHETCDSSTTEQT